tara:strand:- start:2201 stop:2389 length:189 start_codon:yes stop_codon:yes gene_type:complete
LSSNGNEGVLGQDMIFLSSFYQLFPLQNEEAMNQERIQWSWADFKTTVLKFGKIDVSAVVLV